jgi:N-acetylneuraminic acid mutarotase
MMTSFTSFLTTTTLLAFASGGIAASVVVAAAAAEEETSNNNWKVLDVNLPTPLSDNTATYIKSTDMIYIAGGCNSPKGNTYVDLDGLELDFFLCESDSQSLYSFDGTTFTTMADMPQPRYRHAAVVAQNKLWLIGGRTIPEDSIIADVDVRYLFSNEFNVNLT